MQETNRINQSFQFLIIKLALVTLFIFSNSKSQAQEVASKSYQFMLDNLLSHSVEEVSVSEIGNLEEVTFLDARSAKEYQVSKIYDAIRVGYDDVELSSVKQIPKDGKVIVYCSIGYRSEKIAEKLIEDGFTDVSNLYGGIFEWVNQEKEIVNSDNEPTIKIHGYSRVWGVWLKKGEKVY